MLAYIIIAYNVMGACNCQGVSLLTYVTDTS